jgi:1-acyl-sn-glycerol-3-phosphate acyltransferase
LKKPEDYSNIILNLRGSLKRKEAHMKEVLKATTLFVLLNATIYPFGVFLAVALLLFWQQRRIRITNWEKFPHRKQGVLVVVNHRSMLEPFVIAALFFRGYLINPLKYGPMFVVDKSNFWDRWYWWWLRPFLIPVERGSLAGQRAAYRMIRTALEKGRTVVIFPEGGRTDFGPTKDGFVRNTKDKTKRIRKLTDGAGLSALLTDAPVVVIWVDGAEMFLPNDPDRRKLFTKFRFPRGAFIRVIIGEPLCLSEERKEFRKEKKKRQESQKEKVAKKAIIKSVTDKIANSLVELAA